MKEKIGKALFEGNFLRKSLTYLIFKLPKLILQKTDRFLGCLVRYIFALFQKIDRKQIMFIPFQGDFTCNPKYIAEELLRRREDFDIVFSARAASIRNRMLYPDGVRLVEQYSAGFYKELIKSKVVVANSVEFLKNPTPKKKGQVLIETWHGSLGIKRFGEKENHGKAWVAAAKKCGRRANYIISNSSFEDGVYRDTFWKTTPILQYGHPRNDILFTYDDELIQKIRQSVLGNFEALGDYKLVLYAPTFRDSHTMAAYNLDFDSLRESLSQRFGGEWIILVRLHPTVRKAAKKYLSKANAVDVTRYPDIQELMLISDIAITDYSSWIYDFILTGRPGFIYAADIDGYADERGFYYPLTNTPFPIARSNEEMVSNILNFDQERYGKDLRAFLEEKGCVDDGEAAKRVVDKILELLGDVE